MNWSVRLIEGEEFDCETKDVEMTTLRAILVSHEDEDEGDDGDNGQVCGGADVTIYRNATESLQECARYNTIAQVGCIWDLSREGLDFLHASTLEQGEVRRVWRARLGDADTVIILSNLSVDEQHQNLGGATYLLRAARAMLPMPALWVTTTLETNKAAAAVFTKTGFKKSIAENAEDKSSFILYYYTEQDENDEDHDADDSFAEFCNLHLSKNGSTRRTFLNVIMRLHRAWCEANAGGRVIKSQAQLAEQLRYLGFEVVNCNNRRILKNCDLRLQVKIP